MNADYSSGNPSGKRAALPGCAAWFFHQLRVFWITELALLIVVLYGLRAGWSWTAPRQWSDGFFLAGAIQVVIAAVTILAPTGEALDASTVRYVSKGDVSDTRHELFLDTLRRKKFGLRVFLGALLTMLIAEAVLWV